MTVFQFHIPLTLKNYSFLSIGKEHHYLEGIEEKLVSNAFGALQKILKSKGTITLALSGTFIELLRKKNTTLLAQIKAGIKNDQIVLLGTTYHFSLASLYSPALFKVEIKLHQDLVKEVFDYQANIFYNTANIYFDKLSEIYSAAGFQYAMAPVSPWHLNGRDKNLLYHAKSEDKQLMLLEEEDIIDAALSLDMPSVEETPTQMNKESSENYFVPQPIYHKKLVAGKTLSSNALQSAIHQKIVGLKKKIKKQKREELLTQLSVFTAIDFFNGMTKTDDQSNKAPADQYVAMVNVLADFELFHNL